MEILILVVSFLVFIYVMRLLRPNNDSLTLNKIPGPKKLPLIGNLHLLAGKSLPHRAFRDLAVKHGPLMRLQLGEVPYLIVSSTEVAKQVVRTHDITFANRIQMLVGKTITYNFKDIALAPHGEHWRQLRKICTLELLSSKRVRSFRLIREEENLNLAKAIASDAGAVTNLSEKLYLSSFDIITRSSVGLKAADRSASFAWATEETIRLGSGLSLIDLFPSIRLLPIVTGFNYKVSKMFRVIDEILQGIIDQHRARAANHDQDHDHRDLVDDLLKYQEKESHHFHLTTDSIKAVILDMFFGGTDTSATVVAWAMSEMIRNPSTLKRAQEEVREVLDGKGCVDEDMFDQMKYFKSVIKETMRLHPPLPFLIPRMSSERCELNGYQVPEKTRVIINAWAMGRDPMYWSDADKFKPERFEESSVDFKGNDFEYIPFGSGRRICPGMSMGLVNMDFMLATLLYYFDWEMPCELGKEELDMAEAFGATLKRKNDLLLVPIVRRPLAAQN